MAITEQYFMPRSFESKKLYKLLGVVAFNKYINPNSTTNRRPFLETYRSYRSARKPGNNFGGLPDVGSHVERIQAFEATSKNNELTHLTGLVINAALEGFMEVSDSPSWCRIANGALAVVGNVYPIMTQRYNRLRTTHVLEILQQREQSYSTDSNEPLGSALSE
jgi:hypothetical protein